MKLVPLGRPQRAPHPHHLRTWQGGASRGPGGGLSPEPTPPAPRAPASRACRPAYKAGPAAYRPPASQELRHSRPWERAEALNPTQAGIQGWGWGQRGQRQGQWARECPPTPATAGRPARPVTPEAAPGQSLGTNGRALREEGVHILLHHFVRRAARNTSPSPRICPRGCIAQTRQLQMRLGRGQPPGRPCW